MGTEAVQFDLGPFEDMETVQGSRQQRRPDEGHDGADEGKTEDVGQVGGTLKNGYHGDYNTMKISNYLIFNFQEMNKSQFLIF